MFKNDILHLVLILKNCKKKSNIIRNLEVVRILYSFKLFNFYIDEKIK